MRDARKSCAPLFALAMVTLCASRTVERPRRGPAVATARVAAFRFNDLDQRPGQSAYYYVRARIGENDFAWSSPIWVKREK